MLVLRKGNIEKKLSVLCTIIMVHNVRQVLTGWSTVLGFDLAWFSSLFSKRLCIFGLRGAIYIFNKIFAYGTSFSLLFSELSLVGLALDLVD